MSGSSRGATVDRTVIKGGLVFDGRGAEGVPADVLVDGGRVVKIAPSVGDVGDDTAVIDASGCWVSPGFVDLHTHYDAEVEVRPGLDESVRHGVTTVVVGSCGLSMAVGRPVDLADMFCRVEGIPRRIVLPILEARKTWSTPPEYLDHLGTLALGPNVASLLGHSAMRAHVMGIARSLDREVRPGGEELARMERMLEESLEAGYLGLSINTLTWDKMDGDAHRSLPTPSTFARWSEYRRLTRVLRRRGRLLQGVPNVSTKVNVLLFYLESIGVLRPGLRTMLITMMDAKAARLPFRLVGLLSRITRLFGADVRFQSLPNPFDLFVDGMEAPIFEEIAAGTTALSARGHEERARLLRDPSFRRTFAKEWASWFFGRAYHRDLDDTEVLSAPDASLVGKSFGAIARERGGEPLDVFLDLVAEHGDALRWYTVIGNDRPEWLRWIVAHPQVLIGFSDAGAHLRNMAYYNFGVRFLKLVHEAAERGAPVMTTGRAIHRLTGEIADWLGIDAGHLAEGRRADVVVIDPKGLDARADAIHEEAIPGFGDLSRLVRRNEGAVRAVLVGGARVVADGVPTAILGAERTGTVLRASHA
ncbi:MAG: amidohydrolase family protein [Deltaproteobacteria bacterium]|nr:amidohydrolase family protein [Deltaproteobacteria bacterium]